ncbi:MAG: DUF6691 family protein, partial [Bacteroidota bacterium]
MRHFLTILIFGVIFGITLTKAEVVSWYRIQEMFRFDAFHMYGVIGSAVIIGALGLRAFRWLGVKNESGQPLILPPKEPGFARYILGGTLFGLGWAMTGACPGPIYALIGSGLSAYWVVLISA